MSWFIPGLKGLSIISQQLTKNSHNAIKQAEENKHAEILHVLEEYKDDFISKEIAKRRGRVGPFI